MLPKLIRLLLPLILGLSIGVALFLSLHWWGFLVIFPWIGLSISTGILLRTVLKGKKRLFGRKISILMILPCLLFFVPIANNENFQLEGVVLIVLIGFFSKGFIHYAVAKIFGPLIWRRGFCGWACWTAAILDWLPLKNQNNTVEKPIRYIRYIALSLSVVIPLYMIFALSFNPWNGYINKIEMKWMFISNCIYYVIAIPMAFALSDRRAFCKYVCPVSLVMKPASAIGLVRIRPREGKKCIECGNCSKQCMMGIDVMSYMKNDEPVSSTECILCQECMIVCPTGKIR